ncbi:acetyl esterase [Proteus sp. CD3]|uniref:acetyl esterase n=1 Tax=Proteus sp. CD3 TaxID=1921565 RepID=UPI001249D56F|nr:acetyl esterase [Proteus sp. CD3]QEZ93356.1 acetylesterase [Proteus sp. CD3]
MKTKNKINVLKLISPEMQQVMQFYADNPQPAPESNDYPSMRLAYNQDRRYWNADAPEMFSIQDISVSTSYGDVLTRLYQPTEKTPATLYYLHGGGFILGNLDTHDRIMRLLASYTGCAVIGIDYSLSPEAHYPQAIDESAQVCQFYYQHADHYGINTQYIGFAGDSAGAMLSLATVLWLRDKQIHCGKVSAALLWYGLYGLRDSTSRRLYGGEWDGLRQQDLEEYDNAYLTALGNRNAPYYCLFNNDLTQDIPPCFIASAQYDPLIDDSVTLFKTLEAHQLACEYKMYPGTLHAFLHYSRMMKVADDAIRDGAHYFVKQLAL